MAKNENDAGFAAAIRRKYRMPARQAVLPAGRRALGLYQRLLSRLLSGARSYDGFGMVAGKFIPREHGARHEVWRALAELEILLPWSGVAGGSPSSLVIPASGLRPDMSSTGPPTGDRWPGIDQFPPRSEHQYAGHEASTPSPAATVFSGLPSYPSKAGFSPVPSTGMVHDNHAAGRWKGPISKSADQQGGEVPTVGRLPAFNRPGALSGPAAAAFTPPFGPANTSDYARDSGSEEGPASRPEGSVAVSFPVVSSIVSAPNDRGRPVVPGEMGLNAAPWAFPASRSQGLRLGIVQRVLLQPFFPDMDLAEVRIHKDEPADRAARLQGADAFSLGREIFFRAGRFNCATAKGMALLGHELVHSQQEMGIGTSKAVVSRAVLEREADRTEIALLRVFAPGGGWTGGMPGRSAGPSRYQYGPVSLEPARFPAFLPGVEGGMGSGRGNPGPVAGTAGGESAGQPLKAEEGRAAAPAGTSSSPPPAEDSETLMRQVFRSLRQKIRTDKERRGVDRWVL